MEFNGSDKPYHGHSRDEVFDYYYFFVNGRTDFYRDGLKYALKNMERTVPILRYIHSQNGDGVMEPIPQRTFRHWAFDPENDEPHWQKEKI
jgi:hypothetical protein